MTDREYLKQLVDQLPEVEAGKLLDFAEFLRQKQAGPTSGPDAEDRAWLEAPTPTELEAYDWGDADPLAGDRVAWDAAAGMVIVEERP